MSLKRALEPEVMDTEQDALEYEGIDNSKVNSVFVEFLSADLGFKSGSLVDLGTGPGDILFSIAEKVPDARITGVEMGSHMLKIARRKLAASPQRERIRLVAADAKATGLPGGAFDFVICNSLVHHIPDPLQIFREIARLARSGGGLFLKDLRRPETLSELEALVARHAANDTPYQRSLFHASLHAALRPEEVREHAEAAGLTDFTLSLPSDRHWQLSRRMR